MQTRGITTYVKNGSAQKYGKEYSPKSGDKFVLSVTKGETVVLTKEITKSSKYKIESGVALEVGSITQGLASSMTAKYTKSTKYTGPTTKGTNTKLKEEKLISAIEVETVDAKAEEKLPGIVGLILTGSSDLWEIAKKYHTTVSAIRKTNELDEEMEINGRKILVVKEVPDIG